MQFIRKSNNKDWKDQRNLWLLGVCSIIEGLIVVLSLGFLNSDIRAWFLFDFLDE